MRPSAEHMMALLDLADELGLAHLFTGRTGPDGTWRESFAEADTPQSWSPGTETTRLQRQLAATPVETSKRRYTRRLCRKDVPVTLRRRLPRFSAPAPGSAPTDSRPLHYGWGCTIIGETMAAVPHPDLAVPMVARHDRTKHDRQRGIWTQGRSAFMAGEQGGMNAPGNEDLPEVIEALTEMIKAYPRDTRFLSARGLAYEKLWDHRRALEDYNRVIDIAPDGPGGYLDRARVYGDMEEHSRAVEDYDMAIRLSPGNAAAHSSRGACHAQLGDLAGAMSDFDIAILLDPEYPDAHYNRGLTYVEMGEHLRAAEDLGRAIELDPEEPVAHYHRGNAYRDLGEMERALEDFNAAVGLEPDYGLALYARGITRLNLGRYDDALHDFNAVLRLDPDSAESLRGRGVALGSLGRSEEAVGDFDRSLELDPGNLETLTGRGLARTSLGQHELASRGLHQGPRSGPRRHPGPVQPGDGQRGPHAFRGGHRGLRRRNQRRAGQRRGVHGQGLRPHDAGKAQGSGRGLRQAGRAHAGRRLH